MTDETDLDATISKRRRASKADAVTLAVATPKTKSLQSHGRNSKVYVPVILKLFQDRWRPGASTVVFSLDDVRTAVEAVRAVSDNPDAISARNAADVVYRMRSRTVLPDEILSKGFHVLRAIGRGLYQFEKASSGIMEVPLNQLIPAIDQTPMPVRRLLPESIAEMDEQAVLSVVGYCQLLDHFTGMKIYRLRSHVRKSVPGIGQADPRDECPKTMNPNLPTGIELFAGCGGLSTGFLDAGLNVVAGFELDARAVDAYNYNHQYRGSRGFITDLKVASGAELLHRAGIERADFVIGGPPCQPFSIAGKRQGKRDIRADLLGHFIRIVDEVRPSAFMLENVPNLASIDNGEFLEDVKSELRALGYFVDHTVASAADFGVPQNRKRLVILGMTERKPIRFPTATHGTDEQPFASAASAIGDLPDAGEFGETGVYNHEPTMHSADMVARLSVLEPGKRERGSFHDRLHPERPSYTLRAGSGNFSPLRPVHYKHHRVITVRESARLQGFSDDFRWPDRIPRLQQYRQVGNAVPPPMARAFAQCLADQLGWVRDPAAFAGDPATREEANTLTDEQRKALRSARMRGASLGKVALGEK